MLAVSLYILYPTPEEVLIHPVFGLFLSKLFQTPIYYGIIASIILYRIVGVICLSVALLTGGKSVYLKIREKIKKRL
jgi:hypothetical protein